MQVEGSLQIRFLEDLVLFCHHRIWYLAQLRAHGEHSFYVLSLYLNDEWMNDWRKFFEII